MSQHEDEVPAGTGGQKSTDVLASITEEMKEALFAEMWKRQMEMLEKSKDKTVEKEPPSKKLKTKQGNSSKEVDTDQISIHPTESFVIEEDGSRSDRSSKVDDWLNDNENRDPLVPVNDGDPFGDQSSDSILGDDGSRDAIDDKELENILRSKYKEIMDHTVEKRGDPLVPELAGLIKETWGKLKLSTDSKKKLNEGYLVPSNCKSMVTPKLNTEVYIRLEENAQVRDKAMQERQKDISKTTVPVLKAIGNLEKMETTMTRVLTAKKKSGVAFSDEDKLYYRSVKDSLKELKESFLYANYNYTEVTRKRKSEACSSLGPQFRPYVKVEDTGEFLLGQGGGQGSTRPERMPGTTLLGGTPLPFFGLLAQGSCTTFSP